ncbi:MAG: hypothetical protein ACLTDX_06215 [[Clostridium] innocuum]
MQEWVETPQSLDDGTTWHRKNSVLISKAGENKIIFRTADELGRTTSSPEDTVYVNIDKSEAGTLMMKVGSDAAISSSPVAISPARLILRRQGDPITLTLDED